jgi:16S rRNA (adenine1518-N6/adenine1519-N6)-dimethyltransferase
VVRASFNQRRKTLANGIVNGLTVGGKRVNADRGTVVKCLEECGLSPSVRGETLSLSEFAELSKCLAKNL